MAALPDHLQSWASTLLFDYESTGTETLFRDLRDPEPRSRHVFAFHRPDSVFESLKKGSTLRRRLLDLPPVDPAGLRGCQVEAIDGLQASLKRADARALVQMATGAGKTFTACNLVMRLLATVEVKRVLFLVDRAKHWIWQHRIPRAPRRTRCSRAICLSLLDAAKISPRRTAQYDRCGRPAACSD